jgi:hypothetical protein
MGEVMRKLSIQEFAFQDVSAAGIGERNTISNGPDDGTNNVLASHFWNPSRHGTTLQALDNALVAPVLGSGVDKRIATGSAGGLNIGGHGNDGLLETGMGQTGPFNVGQIIYRYNEYNWGPQFDRINPTSITMVSIWSCHTGAGIDGAELLFGMAKRCGRAVRAGTWWEKGYVWQVATPNNKPAPIEAPTPHLDRTEMATFIVGGAELDAAQVEGATITTRSIHGVASVAVAVDGESAGEFAAKALTGPALDLQDISVSGMETGQIDLTFKDGQHLRLTVYNDRLAVDNNSNTGYYLSASLLKATLAFQR